MKQDSFSGCRLHRPEDLPPQNDKRRITRSSIVPSVGQLFLAKVGPLARLSGLTAGGAVLPGPESTCEGGEVIKRDGTWRVHEFTWQMDAILFWNRFQARWLRGDEFHYPEAPQGLPPLKDIAHEKYAGQRLER
jgi:hypothetical protein